MTALRILILLAMLILLQGCGFQLRGTEASGVNLPPDISPVQIQGLANRNILKLELENRFLTSGIQITDDAEQAVSVLQITNRRSDRRVLTVDSSGKVIDYELNESLSFNLTDRAGNERVAMQSVNLIQSYTNRATQLLGSEQEETSLREDLWRRLSDQVFRRLSVQLR
jgi:LPS-assembly lipoprotein